ncbi:MAG: LysR family transcriptional regulator [Ruminiclostridium sp.]|jgi:DNA-binding transcriptional LysR family regulator|nr:LysR family transcriptional regulator [Ruminiclostridium sp.]
MELRVLRYFLAVAREESISAAAESLHLTQPTLSRQLMDLEAELGKTLFLRGNRKVTLTQEGAFLRKRANEILDLVEKTQAEFQTSQEALSGDVYVGGGESDAMRLIARTAGALQSAHPQVRFHLYSGNAYDVGERLEKGLLDFGILMGTADLANYDYLQLPLYDSWGVLMRKDSPLAQKARVRPEDLWDQPLLLSRQALIKSSLSNWLQRDLGALNVVSTYNLLFNASLMVEEGLGYALALDKLINTSGDSPLCFRPLEPALRSELHVVWKKYQVFSKAAEAFLALLRDQAAGIRPPI